MFEYTIRLIILTGLIMFCVICILLDWLKEKKAYNNKFMKHKINHANKDIAELFQEDLSEEEV